MGRDVDASKIKLRDLRWIFDRPEGLAVVQKEGKEWTCSMHPDAAFCGCRSRATELEGIRASAPSTSGTVPFGRSRHKAKDPHAHILYSQVGYIGGTPFALSSPFAPSSQQL